MSHFQLKGRNHSQIMSQPPINRMLNLALEDQTRRAEELDDEGDGATELNEAGKVRMETGMRNHSSLILAPYGLEALELV